MLRHSDTMWYIIIHLVIRAVINDKGDGNSLKLFLFGVQIVIEEIFLTRCTYLFVVLHVVKKNKAVKFSKY